MKKKKLTVRDIAKQCGISAGTVSRVLNNEPGVKEPTRTRVLELIKEHDYNPFRNVPIIKKIKQKAIRVILPWGGGYVFNDQFYMKGLEAIRQTCADLGYELSFVVGSDFNKSLARYETAANQVQSAMGVILFCPQPGWDSEIDRIREWDVPVALVNRTTKRKNVIMVREKREEAIDMVARHAKDLGYRTIHSIGHSLPYLRHQEVLEEKCKEHGLILEKGHAVSGDLEMDTSIGSSIDRIIKEKRLPDLFFASNDRVGMLVIKNLVRLGVKIPGDTAVIGYDNIIMSTYVHPELTTVNNPIDTMSAYATRALIEQIESGKFLGVEMAFDNELIVRESCGGGENKLTVGS